MARKILKPPRRRAKQERAHATVAFVLEAAAQVLQRSGYAGDTTNRIAECGNLPWPENHQYDDENENKLANPGCRESLKNNGPRRVEHHARLVT